MKHRTPLFPFRSIYIGWIGDKKNGDIYSPPGIFRSRQDSKIAYSKIIVGNFRRLSGEESSRVIFNRWNERDVVTGGV